MKFLLGCISFLFVTFVWCVIIFMVGEATIRVFKHYNPESLSAVGTKIFQADPHNTYAHKPLSEDFNGYGEPTPKIYINNLGFRDKNFNPERHKNNILFLGDSFTFGTGLKNADIFPEILERKFQTQEAGNKNLGTLDRWQIWNAGVIGYSIDNYLIALKKITYNQFKPDLVVVNIFVANDITELRRRQWDRDENQKLIRVRDQKLIVNDQAQLENQATQKPSSYFWNFLEQRWTIFQLKYGKIDPRSHEPTLTWPVFLDENHPASDLRLPQFWDRFFEAQKEINQFGNKHGIPIVFNLLPMDVQVSEIYEKKYAQKYFTQKDREADRPQTKILEHCKEKNYTCWDTLPILRASQESEKLFFSHNADPHFDVKGHQVVADFLFDKISPSLAPELLK